MKVRDIVIIVAMVALAVGFTYYQKTKVAKPPVKTAQTETKQEAAANPHAGMPIQGSDQDLFKQWVTVSMQQADIKKIDDTKSEFVATVNGTGISRKDFDDRLAQRIKVMTTSAMHGKQLKENEITDKVRKDAGDLLLNKMIEETFIETEANARGVGITDEAFEVSMNEKKASAGGEKKFKELLSSMGLTEEQIRSNLRNEMVMQKLANVVIPEMRKSAKKNL